MADISITPGNVMKGDTNTVENGTAGATITAGQTVYKKSLDSRYYLADCDATAVAANDEIKELYEKGQPVLVGTISIEKSEILSKMLKRAGIVHSVLNAKHHQKEAEIIAEAGQKKTLTISTNMAGRGTDIVLGEGVVELDGLHILGTERHESRRIDNQLRGRSGRQGDPGTSRFYLSLEDDLLRIFGSDRISSIMDRLGMEEGQPIEHNLISRAIENAQRKVESHQGHWNYHFGHWGNHCDLKGKFHWIV